MDDEAAPAGPPPAPVGGVVAIVLAAGGGTRFQGAHHKLTSRLASGRTVAAQAVQVALDAGIGPVVVVTGAVTEVPGGSDRLELPGSVHVVHNPDWAQGQSTSLRVGLDTAIRLHPDADAVVVGLADQPGVVADAWRRVAASPAPIAVATYDGTRGNPVRLERSLWAELRSPPPGRDEGARGLIRSRPHLVHAVPCPGSPDDIDTVEDLQRWQNRSSTNSP